MGLKSNSFLILDDHEYMSLLPEERREMLNNRFYFRLDLKQYGARFEYTQKVQEWCQTNCTTFFYIRYTNSDLNEFTVYSLEPNDAVHFKLYWAGKPEEL